jgi:hypothetical protein
MLSGQSPTALYACIVLQPPPVLISPGRAHAELLASVSRLKRAITAQGGWRDEGKAPFCIRDASPLRVLATVQRSKMHCLVWFSTGHEKSACSTPAPLAMGAVAAFVQELPQPSRPRVVVVCMQYGAEHAAVLLKRSGVPTVAWIGMDPAVSKEAVLIGVIKPLLDLLEGEHTQPQLEARFKELRNGVSIDLDGGIVMMSSGLRWRNPVASLTPFVQLDVHRSPPSNLVDEIAAASQLLASDVQHVKRLSERLRSLATRAMAKHMPPSERTLKLCAPQDADLARCRAIVLEASSAFLRGEVVSGEGFELIWRVTNSISLLEAKDRVQQLEAATLEEIERKRSLGSSKQATGEHGTAALMGKPMLLWVDLRARVSSQLKRDVAAFLQQLLSDSPASVVLLTCNSEHKSAGELLEQKTAFEVLAEQLHARVVPIEPADKRGRACQLHDELHLSISRPAGRVNAFTDSEISFETLREAIESVLQGPPVAALYLENDLHLLARICVSDVGFLHELRDRVLEGSFALDLQAKLRATTGDHTLIAQVDLSAFASSYETSVFQLDQLTPHQQEKFDELAGGCNLRVMAPAGAGKTFLALHKIMHVLELDVHANVLFVVRNAPLAFQVAAWVCARLPPEERLARITRLWLLIEPFENGPRRCSLSRDETRIEFGREGEAGEAAFKLVVVDEGHHIYKSEQAKRLVEAYVGEGTSRMVLADISQSMGGRIAYPNDTPEPVTEATLTQVVRCSGRIVAGAMSFQLGDKKLQTECQHESKGPPLKTFLFDVSSATSREVEYVEQTMRAVAYLQKSYQGLSLHNRLAILVPDAAFLASIREPLEQRLTATYPERGFRLIDGREASSAIAAPGGARRGGQDVVLDVVDNFDGLERLLVIGVGLDSAISAADGEVLETPLPSPLHTAPLFTPPLSSHRPSLHRCSRRAPASTER